MITGSYDFDTIDEEAFDIALKIDLTLTRLANTKARWYKCKGYEHYDYQRPSKSRHVSILPDDDVDDSKVIKDISVSSETTNIIEDISIGPYTSILDEDHASYEGISEIVNVIVESGTPLTVDVHAHDIHDVAPELVESNVSSQIFLSIHLSHLW